MSTMGLVAQYYAGVGSAHHMFDELSRLPWLLGMKLVSKLEAEEGDTATTKVISYYFLRSTKMS